MLSLELAISLCLFSLTNIEGDANHNLTMRQIDKYNWLIKNEMQIIIWQWDDHISLIKEFPPRLDRFIPPCNPYANHNLAIRRAGLSSEIGLLKHIERDANPNLTMRRAGLSFEIGLAMSCHLQFWYWQWRKQWQQRQDNVNEDNEDEQACLLKLGGACYVMSSPI